jgi:hypothetical protein
VGDASGVLKCSCSVNKEIDYKFQLCLMVVARKEISIAFVLSELCAMGLYNMDGVYPGSRGFLLP